MVFDPKTGLLRRLSTFNAGEEIANLHELYDLYDVEGATEVKFLKVFVMLCFFLIFITPSCLELAAIGQLLQLVSFPSPAQKATRH